MINKVRDVLRVGDIVEFYSVGLKAKFITKVTKVTEKRFHCIVRYNTIAIVNNERVDARSITKLGTKYISYDSIEKINGIKVHSYIKMQNELNNLSSESEGQIKIA